jgi:hypothetical protein
MLFGLSRSATSIPAVSNLEIALNSGAPPMFGTDDGGIHRTARRAQLRGNAAGIASGAFTARFCIKPKILGVDVDRNATRKRVFRFLLRQNQQSLNTSQNCFSLHFRHMYARAPRLFPLNSCLIFRTSHHLAPEFEEFISPSHWRHLHVITCEQDC